VAHREEQQQPGELPFEGYFACAHLGLGAADTLAASLDTELTRVRLGRVASAKKDRLTLTVASDSPAALAEVARILARLKAPLGTWVGNAECPRMIDVAHLQGRREDSADQIFQGSVSIGRYGTLALYPQAEARLRAVLESATRRDGTRVN